MSLDRQTRGTLTEIVMEATAILAERETMIKLSARYDYNHVHSKIANQADLDEIPELAHLTQAKVQNAIDALEAMVACMGDVASEASCAAALLKVKG